MEKLRKTVNQIAYTAPSQRLSTLSAAQLSLIPLLSFASYLYGFALHIRHQLYRFNFLPKHRLTVPVISVGNLTWGGNGKTPMVEYLASLFADNGILPLILTRGYGGADEAKMLQRQLGGKSAKIGVGANRAATAAHFLEQYGYTNLHDSTCPRKLLSVDSREVLSISDQIGVAILDDGMQHLSVRRDLEIVMVNAMMTWGNHRLIPLGPLREPLTALSRADIVIIHHADLVQEKDVEALESTIREANQCLPIFFTKMTPIHFFTAEDVSCKVPLKAADNMIILCLSGIGCADSFVRRIEKIGPIYVDHLNFTDHHLFILEDVEMVRSRLQALESKFATKPVVVITEKDYDRAPKVFEELKPYKVLVLCCRLQFLGRKGSTEDVLLQKISKHLNLSGENISSSGRNLGTENII